MTDAELIAQLRDACYLAFDDGTNDFGTAPEAADRIEALNAQIERMWDALEYVDAHIDLEEEISEEFAETVRVLLWENNE
jgi:hypothetical protein